MNKVNLMALLLSSATLVACGGGDGAAKVADSDGQPLGGGAAAPTEALRTKGGAPAQGDTSLNAPTTSGVEVSGVAASPSKKNPDDTEGAASPAPEKAALVTLSTEVLEGVIQKLDDKKLGDIKSLHDKDGKELTFNIARGGLNKEADDASFKAPKKDFALRFSKELEINIEDLSSRSLEESVSKVREALFANATLRTEYSNNGYRVKLRDLKKHVDKATNKENLTPKSFAFRPEEDGKFGVTFPVKFTNNMYEEVLKVVDAITLEVLELSGKYEFNASGELVAKAQTLDSAKKSVAKTPKAKTPAAKTPKDATGKKGASARKSVRSAVKTPKSGKKGEFVAFGQTFEVGAPVYANLTGEMSAKESNVLGTMFYGANNALFGIAQAYVNGAEGFALGGKQTETSAVSAFMAGDAFVEFQSGVVSADKVNGADWNGSRQQVVVGYDFTSGFTPFLQVGARQLSQDGVVSHNEKSGYAGVTFETEKKNSFFGYTSSITAKTGAVVSSVSGAKADSALFVEQGFTTTEGLKLDAAMSVSSQENASFKVSVGFSR